MIGAFFKEEGNSCRDRLRLKIYFSKGIKRSIQSSIIKTGIPLNPTDLDGFSHIIALRTSATVKGSKNKL